MKKEPRLVAEVYRRLDAYFGPLRWWPAETPLEVMLGAILTQNTSWTNVEKSIALLKQEKKLSFHALEKIPVPMLAELIHSSGFFTQKSATIKRLLMWIREEYQGKIARMAEAPLKTVRPGLLQVKGIGPETADSILLYALSKPVFVVDAYTRRLFGRLGLLTGTESYETIRVWLEASCQSEERARYYNQYHALIVETAKQFCRSKRALCEQCPLKPMNRCIV